MKRKILCTALALVILHGMTPCASAPNIQPEADKISGKIPPQQSLSAPDVTDTVRDSTAAEAPVGNTDNSANEPSSTTACDPKPDAHLEAEKNAGTPSPQPSLSAPDMTGVVQDSTTKESPGGNIDYSVYEPYGLLYDSQNRCYTFNDSIVRYFNDPAAGASFTNYFTGAVDIEAEYDAKTSL